MACNNCPKVDCQSYPDAHCVVYTGPSLTNLGVSANTRLDIILQKINQYIVNGGGSSLFKDDTSTIALTGAGTSNSHLSATLKVGAQDNNATSVLTWNGSTVRSYPISNLRDNKVKVSANDTTAGYLNGKLVAGPNVSLTELNDGSNESLRISYTETDPVALSKNITLNSGIGISVSGTPIQSLGNSPVWTINHADTSSVANLDTSGAQVIDQMNFDTFGHVQNITLRTLTLSDLGYVAPVESDPIALSKLITVNAGAGIAIAQAASQSLSSTPSWTITHADTSAVPNVSTSGAQVMNGITFDTYGHVQSLTLRTLTLSDLGYTPIPYPTAISFTGTTTKTLHLTLSDSTVLTASFTDLNTGSGGGSGLASAYISLSDGTNSATASGADTITFRSGNNLLDIVVTDNDPTYGDKVQYTVNQPNLTSFVKTAVKAVEVRFKVGHSGSPLVAGGTSFILKDCTATALTNRVIKLYIEGSRKYYADDYVYDPSTATITLSAAVAYGQRFIIEAYPSGTWDECSLNAGETTDFPYDFPFSF